MRTDSEYDSPFGAIHVDKRIWVLAGCLVGSGAWRCPSASQTPAKKNNLAIWSRLGWFGLIEASSSNPQGESTDQDKDYWATFHWSWLCLVQLPRGWWGRERRSGSRAARRARRSPSASMHPSPRRTEVWTLDIAHHPREFRVKLGKGLGCRSAF